MIHLVYENNLTGFLAAIYRAFYLRRMDIAIIPDSAELPLLFECVHVPADEDKARRVEEAIVKKLGRDVEILIQHAWLSHLDGIEAGIFRYLKLAFKLGGDISGMMQNPDVSLVVKTAARVSHEAHRYMQFVRFRRIGSIYAADVEPDAEILPLIAAHFADRFREQDFIIRDRRYGKALIHSAGRTSIVDMTDFTELSELAEDDTFEEMWTGYYHAMCIEARKNRRCMLHNMPLKYHKYMTEKW